MSLVCDLAGGLVASESIISRSLDSMRHTERYERRTLLNDGFCFLGCTKYDEYPTAVLETEDRYIYLEGRLYGKNSAQALTALSDLAERVFRPHSHATETVADWVHATDGDFIVVLRHKRSNEVAIVGDLLGRLPLYYCETGSKIIVARELRFITDFASGRRFDRMAIAHYLLFGHTLGRRTLLEHVNRLPPAGLIRISLERKTIDVQQLHDWNLDEKKHGLRSLGENTSQLAKLYSEACSGRSDSTKTNIVSLSGGLDSRSVAAGLYARRVPFSTATFLDFGGRAEADARIAERVAHVLGAEWRLFRLSPPKGRDLARLLKTKGGLNSLEMAFILPFFDKILESYGSRVTYFTGDGGGNVKPGKIPSVKLQGSDDLINLMVSGLPERVFTLDETSALTRISRDDILAEIKAHVSSYPETDWNRKYAHFRSIERGVNLRSEGEDRNRFFFWSVTPLYSNQFFEYVINCPDEQKARHVLYRHFLLKMCPRAASVTDATGALAAARRARIPGFMVLSRLLYSNRLGMPGRMLLARRRSRVKRSAERAPRVDANATLVDCLAAQVQTCDSVSAYLSGSALQQILDDHRQRSREALARLLTITSAIEAVESGVSTIEKYADVEFA
jgi:asparagine synthase (glutamine-hydrolysing)